MIGDAFHPARQLVDEPTLRRRAEAAGDETAVGDLIVQAFEETPTARKVGATYFLPVVRGLYCWFAAVDIAAPVVLFDGMTCEDWQRLALQAGQHDDPEGIAT